MFSPRRHLDVEKVDPSLPAGGSAPARGQCLLIYAPVPLYADAGTLHLEDQACNGLRLWAENFERLIVMMPLESGKPPSSWVPIGRVGPALERIEIHPFPVAFRPDRFLRHLPAARRRIRELIGRADYLGFSIGGLFGDWGSVACAEAALMRRPYYVWTDRVESEVTRRTMNQGPWRQRLRARLTHRPMAWLERALIRRAALGLFHGRETYDHYASFCRQPQMVHDIHIGVADHIPSGVLATKLAAVAEGPLRICYVGRADPMKGPLDWIEVLEKLAAAQLDFTAVWLGEGQLLEAARGRIEQGGLSDRVSFPGFARDRTEVLETLRASHVLVFCHKTPESPRCLIEALISGCPIVGYESAFPRDLTAPHGGGVFVALDDTGALAHTLTELAADRGRLAALIQAAVASGKPFTDVAVFRHRSDLIKKYLPPLGSA